MAKIKVDIVANYKDASQGIGNVKKSIKSLRSEIVDNQNDTSKLAAAEQAYNNAIKKQLGLVETLNGEKQGLEKGLKILKTEQYEFNSALGEGNKYAKSYQVAIDSIEADLEKYKKTTAEASEKTNILGMKFASVVLNVLKFQVVLKIMNSVKTVLRESTQAAAEAEQVFSKLATVFAGLEDSASKMASSLATSLGVAQSTAASALSTVGDLLQAQGMGTNASLEKASEWVEKFQDIIAFKDINMDLEEFAQNFMSGAAGNLRNFRTFGSIVKESAVQAELAKRGLDSLSGSQLELEKMTIRAEMALEQQANAIGATAREWETTLSITRRYNEQNKALMENIGDAINTKLNPLKAWWADIAEQINKAHEAQVQFNAGQKNISVYDIDNNEKDYKAFKNEIISTIYGKNPYRNTEAVIGNTAQQLVTIMTKYNASFEDIEDVWTDIPDAIKEAMSPLVSALEVEKQNELKVKAIQADWVSTYESAIDLMQWLDSITGANSGKAGDVIYSSVNRTAPTTSEGLTAYQKSIELNLNAGIKDIIKSFKNADWQTYASSLDLDFGTATETDSLDTKITELKTLYGYIKAFVSKDGIITDAEQGYLDSLLSIYDSILARQKEITDEEERQLEVTEQKKDLLATASNYRSQTAQIGMTDEEQAFYELEQQFQGVMSIAGLTAEEIEELNSAYNDAVVALTELQARQKEYNNETTKNNALQSAQEGTTDYQKQIRQLKMTDFEKVIDDLSENLGKYGSEVDEAINNQIQAYTDLYNAQQEYTKELENSGAWQALGQNALGSLGTVGSSINTFISGEGDIWTRLLAVCLDIFQQSEYFAEIVAIINQLIEPILPLVEAIFYTISSLNYVFEPIIFALKVISSLVAEVLFVVNMIIDVFEWLWDNLKIALKNVAVDIYNLFHWFNQKDRESYKSLTDYWGETIAQTNEVLEKIWNKIPNEDSDLSTLENLLKSGIINLDQYNAGLRVQQKDMIFDPVTPVDYVASSSRGETTIKYGDVSIVINGGNKEEIQSVLINVMRKAGYDVSNVPITA